MLRQEKNLVQCYLNSTIDVLTGVTERLGKCGINGNKPGFSVEASPDEALRTAEEERNALRAVQDYQKVEKRIRPVQKSGWGEVGNGRQEDVGRNNEAPDQRQENNWNQGGVGCVDSTERRGHSLSRTTAAGAIQIKTGLGRRGVHRRRKAGRVCRRWPAE